MSRLPIRLAMGALLVVLAGCANLVILPKSNITGPQSFCRLAEPGPHAGELIVIIRNNGSGSMGTSITRVDFLTSLPYITANIISSVSLNAPGLGGWAVIYAYASQHSSRLFQCRL